MLVRTAAVISAMTLLMMSSTACHAAPAGSNSRSGPKIRIEDVARFYAIYDAAGGRPSAEQLQRDYLDAGSEGLHSFAKLRNITGGKIAAEIAKDPAIYAHARQCAAVLPSVRGRLEIAMHKLSLLYPDARFPPITIAVGRGKPVAVGNSRDGVIVGLEALCSVKYFDANVGDRFVHVIAHEYIHVQQPDSVNDDDHPTVLEASLMEGGAEFMAELISGAVADSGVWAEVKGHGKTIETRFVADENNTDLSKWFYTAHSKNPGISVTGWDTESLLRITSMLQISAVPFGTLSRRPIPRCFSPKAVGTPGSSCSER